MGLVRSMAPRAYGVESKREGEASCPATPAEQLSEAAIAQRIACAAAEEAFWSAAQDSLLQRERRERLGAFLKEHGFRGVNSRRSWLWRHTYPLHVAAKQGDAELVGILLEAGAYRHQKDSKGRTARQLAKGLDNDDGSHAAVIQVLARRGPRKKHTIACILAAAAAARQDEPSAALVAGAMAGFFAGGGPGAQRRREPAPEVL